MDAVTVQAIKDLLHMIVDKEEPAVIKDLLTKYAGTYAVEAQALAAAVLPTVQTAEDALVEKI